MQFRIRLAALNGTQTPGKPNLFPTSPPPLHSTSTGAPSPPHLTLCLPPPTLSARCFPGDCMQCLTRGTKTNIDSKMQREHEKREHAVQDRLCNQSHSVRFGTCA